MKFLNYLENKIFYILFQIVIIMSFSLILNIIKVPIYYIVLFSSFLLFLLFVYLIIDFSICKSKYLKIINLVDSFEEKYYISEIIPKSNNLENMAYIYALKQASKSMNDKISSLEKDNLDYQEYIESFVHEIKTPISALSLIFDNNKDKISKRELDKIDSYIDQILYYARCDNPEKDYFVKEINLSDLIHSVLLKYRTYLLDEKIMVIANNLEKVIYTDEKWLQFVISQIIQNAIKYMDKDKKQIKIVAKEQKDNIVLSIKDNGCGIKESDIGKVFEKGFTGSDRSKTKSTGIGLYLAKKICDKLGLNISIDSEYKKGTTLSIVFPKTNFNKLF